MVMNGDGVNGWGGSGGGSGHDNDNNSNDDDGDLGTSPTLYIRIPIFWCRAKNTQMNLHEYVF